MVNKFFIYLRKYNTLLTFLVFLKLLIIQYFIAAVGRREGIHECVAQEVSSVFKGKTASHLQALQAQIEKKITNQTQGVDIGYWESLLSQLKGILHLMFY